MVDPVGRVTGPPFAPPLRRSPAETAPPPLAGSQGDARHVCPVCGGVASGPAPAVVERKWGRPRPPGPGAALAGLGLASVSGAEDRGGWRARANERLRGFSLEIVGRIPPMGEE